ncbi:MAG TPA: DUF2239 family protein [Gemmatimonadales bacterium]
MEEPTQPNCIAFEGPRRIAAGPLGAVALEVKRRVERGDRGPILVFDAETSTRIDIDVRGSEAEVLARLEPRHRGPGRPRLGVVPREVTLLPRHWDWLNGQSGGASVTLRKLVDQARRTSVKSDRVRTARESAYRFMVAMAGDRPGFEEATRALFAGDRARFKRLVQRWPADIKAHATALMSRTLDA